MRKVGGIYFWNIGPVGGSFYLKKGASIVPALQVAFATSFMVAGLLSAAIVIL